MSAILTNKGLAAIAAAIAGGGQVSIAQMAIGDGNGAIPTPDATQTALVHEVWRADITSVTIAENNPNHIRAKLTLPATIGGWTIREVGLYDTNADLIAVGSMPNIPKPGPDDGTPSVVDAVMVIEVSNAGAFEIKIDPTDTSAFLRVENNLNEIKRNGAEAQETAQENLGLADDAFLDRIERALNERKYKVGGELYITGDDRAPSIILGFGTWARFGQGRTLVSRDPLDTDFNVTDKKGGQKTVALDVTQMPKHRANIPPQTLATSHNGAHDHTVGGKLYNEVGIVNGNVASGGSQYENIAWSETTSNGGAHVHTVNLPLQTSNEIGGDQAHTNLQPYVVVNIWQRIA